MNQPSRKSTLLYPGIILTITLLSLFGKVHAHGGVAVEEDICMIRFGFYKAHFTVYQRQTRGGKEFCEDLPDAGPTTFVMGYLHDSLKEVPVDFRIIRNTTDLGRYVKWSDLEKIGDLEPMTVFYLPPERRADAMLKIHHTFDRKGDYIGVVTAPHPNQDKVYRAVFPFQVGNSRFVYIALAAILAVLLFLQWRFRKINTLMRGLPLRRDRAS